MRAGHFSDLLARSVLVAALLLVAAPSAAKADVRQDSQWYASSLDLAAAHRITKGDGVVVGLIDSGVKADHPGLRGVILSGADYEPYPEGDATGRDDLNGHGTAMAGVIAGRGFGDGTGVIGIAPSAKILPIRVPIDTLAGSAEITRAVNFAIDRGAKVINMSMGSEQGDDQLRGAVAAAQSADIVFVAAVGNGVKPVPSFPGAYPEVLTVGATDKAGKVASFSLPSAQVDIVAPGADVTVPCLGKSGYCTASGTSNATAVVSGAAALIRAKFPDLSAAEVVNRLVSTVDDIGPPGRDDSSGYGRLNLVRALTADVAPLPAASASSSAETAAARPPDSSEYAGTPLRKVFPLILLLGGVLLLLGAGAVIVVFMVRRSRV